MTFPEPHRQTHCLQERKNMTTNTNGDHRNWNLSLVRKYSPTAKKIEVSTFYFGRDLDELAPTGPLDVGARLLAVSKGNTIAPNRADSEARSLPLGLISLLEKAVLTEEALEVGFHVEMTLLNPGQNDSWSKFVTVAEATRWDRSNLGFRMNSMRATYVESGTTDTLEFVSVDPWGEKMPTCIWVRVKELPDEILAGVIAEGILSHNIGFQTTLDEFMDLGFESTSCSARELPLPGPPPKGCC